MNDPKESTLPETDAAIVARVTAGDTETYAVIMQRYEQKLMRYVIYLIHDGVAAADVVQDTFIKAYKNLNSYNSKYQFSSWIYRIAHNEAMNAVKREKHIDHDADVETIHEASYDPEISRKIDAAILRENVQLCLDGLEPKYREILMLYYYEDMKYTEIADILHMPTSTVGVHIARAKSKLKKLCEQKGIHHE